MKSKKRPSKLPEEWEVIPNTHEGIVTQEEFDIVQQLITSRRLPQNKGGFVNIFAGVIKCVDCGCALRAMNVHRRKEAGLRITCMITNTTEGMGTPAVSEQVYKGLFADDPGFMLIYSIDDQEWFIYSSGMESAPLTEEQENELWNEFAIQDYYVDCVDAYLDAAAAICSVDSQGVAEPAATDSQGDDQTAGADTSETTEVSGSNTQEAGSAIPQERQLPLLVDDAGLLTEEEADALLDKLEEISERQECEVAVVTVDSLEGKTSQDYADDFYDYNGYGYGKDDDGILLLISMEDRDYAITTYGFGITAFTDAGLQYVVNDFKPALSGGRYGDAFNDFADCCDKFLTQAHTGEPYDGDNMPKGTVHPVYIPISLLFGFLISLLIGRSKSAKLKSVRKKESAADYQVAGSMRLYQNSDVLVASNVTSRVVSRSSGSSSGGSSTHTSSSGRSHGGTSGKF